MGKTRKQPHYGSVRVFFRRIRVLLLTIIGVFLTCFVALPMAFEKLAPAVQAQDAAPLPAPLSLPKEGELQQIMAMKYSSDITVSPTVSQSQTATLAPTPKITSMPTPAATEQAINTPNPTQYEELSVGSEGDEVADLQLALVELSYMELDMPTKYYGSVTEEAVRRFQRSHYMKETGIATPELLALIYSGQARPYALSQGYTGEDVADVQYRLAELGFYYSKANGYFGVATRRAVLAFQQKNKIAETGVVDVDTRLKLFSYDARPAIDPTPTPKPTPTPTRTPRPTVTANAVAPKPQTTPKQTATPKPQSTPTVPPQASWWTTPSTPKPTNQGYTWEIPVYTPNAEATARPTAAPTQQIEYAGEGLSAFLKTLKAQVGKPYKWGARGPNSFDCSGLVYYCLRSSGVSIGRLAARSYAEVDAWQTVTSKKDFKIGDLIFYKSSGTSNKTITHVAIWWGNNMILHASASVGEVEISEWGTWSATNFIIAKRVFD